MSVYCDWCGDLIDSSRRGVITLEVRGFLDSGSYVSGTRLHFHAGAPDDESCILSALSALVDKRRVKSEAEREAERERAEREAERERAEREAERERAKRRAADNALVDADNARAGAGAIWRSMTRERRETLVLQALGAERLTIRELTNRMSHELGLSEPDRWGRLPFSSYQHEVGNLVKRMLREAELDREGETFNVNHLRYRYFRRRGLEGSIAELERTYYDDRRTPSEGGA